MNELKTFPFVNHTCVVSYPERNSRAQLGGGWTYTEKPAGPPARTLTLSFNAMRYYLTENGKIDATEDLANNLHALDLFYQEHEQHAHFIYEHYAYGTMVVIFKSPFKTPELLANGSGASQGFQLELIEIPV